MKLVDRLLVRGYLKAYVICLTSLLTLYIVVDLFTNLDDFAEHHSNLTAILKHIGTYYGYKVSQIFDRLCEAIVLLAATFTMAWIQRNNELLPLLSAGVSTRRVVRPILLGACATLGLSVVNQELIIPRIGIYLMNPRHDPKGENEVPVGGAYEPNGIHIEGQVGSRKGMVVKGCFVVIPPSIAGCLVKLDAAEARYIPPANGPQHSGGWLLTGTQPAQLENWNLPVLEMIDPGKYFLKTDEVDFDTITRPRTWFNFASTARLSKELSKPDTTRLAAMAVLFHMRLTRPLVGMILVLMGLSVILRDQNRNVFISSGMCLVLCALFFAAQFAAKQLGDNDIISPALAAWLPVLLFGPLSFAMFDAIHT
ncbi:MAG TPA: LptF/LptG family permease [Gemmataceae bacterium]|jgi:lipopolysaccharide export system permease protein|nr:LptF/LptG family permease [Gemmataceae bacterium]